MNIKFKKDSRIQGLIKIKKSDFTLCKSSGCIHFNKCTSVKPQDIDCIYKEPLVRFTDSKFNLEPDGFGKLHKLRSFFKQLAWRKRFGGTFHNDTNQTFLNDLAKHLAGESTPDLTTQFVAFSSAYDNPEKTTVLELELGRVVPSTVTRNNAQVVIEASFGLTDANTLLTNTGTPVSASQFNIVSTTGLQVGDRVEVLLSALGDRVESRKVSVISGTLITLSTALSLTPTAGDTFRQMISRVQLVHGGATSTLNSGSPTSIAQYIDTKKSTDTLTITYQVTFI